MNTLCPSQNYLSFFLGSEMRDVGFNWLLPRALPLRPDKCQTHLHTVIVFFLKQRYGQKRKKEKKSVYLPPTVRFITADVDRSTLLSECVYSPRTLLEKGDLECSHLNNRELQTETFALRLGAKGIVWISHSGASIFICVCTWKLPTEEIWKSNWEQGPRGLCKGNTTDPMPAVAYTLAEFRQRYKSGNTGPLSKEAIRLWWLDWHMP